MSNRDVAIIGQGPAGLSAAIYTARAGLDTLVLGCDPKVAGDYDIDNYFGFPQGIKGKELMELGCDHAVKYGAELICEKVLAIHMEPDQTFRIRTDSGEHRARAVILATGVSRVRPGIKNISEYEGKGVSYCVSCDGFFFRGKKVAVVGEGVFAANQALELKEYTPDVKIFTQGREPDMPDIYLERLKEMNVPVLRDKIVRLEGDQFLERAILENDQVMDVDGLFVAMGEASSMDFAYSLGITTQKIFIEADHEQKTNVPGIFAAGDCVGRFMQISVAVGEGAIAARSAINYLKKQKT